MPIDQTTYQSLYNDPEFAKHFPTDEDRVKALAHLDPQEFGAMGPDEQLSAAKTMFSGPRFQAAASMANRAAGGDIPPNSALGMVKDPVWKRFLHGAGMPASMDEMAHSDPVMNTFEHPSVEGVASLLTGPAIPFLHGIANTYTNAATGDMAGAAGGATAMLGPIALGAMMPNKPVGTPIYGEAGAAAPKAAPSAVGALGKFGIRQVPRLSLMSDVYDLVHDLRGGSAKSKQPILGYNMYDSPAGPAGPPTIPISELPSVWNGAEPEGGAAVGGTGLERSGIEPRKMPSGVFTKDNFADNVESTQGGPPALKERFVHEGQAKKGTVLSWAKGELDPETGEAGGPTAKSVVDWVSPDGTSVVVKTFNADGTMTHEPLPVRGNLKAPPAGAGGPKSKPVAPPAVKPSGPTVRGTPPTDTQLQEFQSHPTYRGRMMRVPPQQK